MILKNGLGVKLVIITRNDVFCEYSQQAYIVLNTLNLSLYVNL